MKRELLLVATTAALFFAAIAGADEAAPPRRAPAKVGVRTAAIAFSSGENGKAVDLEVVSSEVLPLSGMALSLLRTGQVKAGSPGVTQLAENRYRLDVTYKIPDDAAPLPADVTLPIPRVRTTPVYPYELRSKKTAGGALLRLTIDDKARVKKVEWSARPIRLLVPRPSTPWENGLLANPR